MMTKEEMLELYDEIFPRIYKTSKSNANIGFKDGAVIRTACVRATVEMIALLTEDENCGV